MECANNHISSLKIRLPSFSCWWIARGLTVWVVKSQIPDSEWTDWMVVIKRLGWKITNIRFRMNWLNGGNKKTWLKNHKYQIQNELIEIYTPKKNAKWCVQLIYNWQKCLKNGMQHASKAFTDSESYSVIDWIYGWVERIRISRSDNDVLIFYLI